jgi:hypothetical protein
MRLSVVGGATRRRKSTRMRRTAGRREGEGRGVCQRRAMDVPLLVCADEKGKPIVSRVPLRFARGAGLGGLTLRSSFAGSVRAYYRQSGYLGRAIDRERGGGGTAGRNSGAAAALAGGCPAATCQASASATTPKRVRTLHASSVAMLTHRSRRRRHWPGCWRGGWPRAA